MPDDFRSAGDETCLDLEVVLEIGGHEAVVRQAYRDSRGVWTWSVGLTSATGHDVERYIAKPQPLERCLTVFLWALERYAEDVRQAFAGIKINKTQFTGALSFHWNTGAIKKASWVKSFKAGEIARARRQFMQWNKPKEIIGRRAKERDLFFDGKWSNDGTMTEYTRLTTRLTPNWKSARRINIEEPLRAAFVAAGLSQAPAAIPEPPPRPADLGPAPVERRIDATAVQRALKDLGYHEVGIVGDPPGGRTAGAIAAFRHDRGVVGGSALDQALVDELARARAVGWRRPMADARANAPAKDIARRLPEAQASWWAKFSNAVQALVATAVAMVSGVLDHIEPAREYIAPLNDYLGDVPPWGWGVLVAGVALVAWRMSQQAEASAVHAFRAGERT